MDNASQRVSDLEDRLVGTTQSKQQTESQTGKKKAMLETYWILQSGPIYAQ